MYKQNASLRYKHIIWIAKLHVLFILVVWKILLQNCISLEAYELVWLCSNDGFSIF